MERAEEKNERREGLDFSLIERPLDTVLVALENKIDREWPGRLSPINGAREIFLLTARVARNTYQTVRWICADKPKEPLRRPQYSISVPPLNRTILDSIFTVLFLIEDLPSRCTWYHKAGWRETRLWFDRLSQKYGDSPKWSEWLRGISGFVERGKEMFGITEQEASNPRLIPSWPNPGKMVRYKVRKGEALPPARQFLEHLNDWYYRDHSEEVHLTGWGLMRRGAMLLSDFYPVNGLDEKVQKYRSDQVMTSIILVLALASEVEAFLKFGLGDRMQYVWAVLVLHSDVARELYEMRYSGLMQAQAGCPPSVL